MRALAFDALSVTRGDELALEPFAHLLGGSTIESCEAANPFTGQKRLPTLRESSELLVDEALARAGGNQTLAARMLGISQPALSKRLKQREGRP